MRQKKVTRFAGYGMKNMRPTFKTEMLVYQSRANLDEKSLFGKIAHHLGSEIRKILVNGKFEDSLGFESLATCYSPTVLLSVSTYLCM